MLSSILPFLPRPKLRGFWRVCAATGCAVALLPAVGLVSGCSSGAPTYQAGSNTTLGRELQDLQESYDKGIITKKEYEEAKKRLIKKYTD